MTINLFWTENGPVKQPYARTSITNEEGVDLLSCLLGDDGGCVHSIEDIDDGLQSISLAKANRGGTFDWARHSWAVEFKGEGARIYSLYDEKYDVVMHLDDFEIALKGWRAFVSPAK